MDINYLGYVYPTYYALPHLKKSKGQIGVVGSVSGSNSKINCIDITQESWGYLSEQVTVHRSLQFEGSLKHFVPKFPLN
jgi:hypothetical protein